MSTRQWFQLSSQLIQMYKQSQIAYKYKKLPLQYFHIAIAKFSGPIAVLFNKYLSEVQVKLSQQNETSIMIFNPKGQLKRTIPFDMKDRVILFRFTQVEELLILYASGQYVLIDPFSGKRFQGTFFIGQDQVNRNINERCIGAVFQGEQLYVVREKQFGIIRNLKSYWTAIPSLKPNIENPVFAIENLSAEKKRMNGSLLGTLVYLSKQGTIQQYNPQTSIKRTIFQAEYLKSNSTNLLCLSKRQTTLILIFRSPFKILHITLTQSPLKPIPQTSTHDLLLQLKQRIQISKKKSKHNYMSLNHQIIWLGNSNISIYNNGKVLVIFDAQNVKAIYNHHTENRMIYSVVQEVDGVRVVGEEHVLYRRVSDIYQELVCLESLQEAQFKLFADNQQLVKEKQLLRERLLYNKVQEFELTPKQKQLIIHELHEIYQKYINKQMIPISDLNSLKPFAGPMLKQIIENGVKCLDKLQLIKIMKFATFVMNYFSFSVSKKDRQSDIRMSQLKLMQSQDDLSIPNSGNLCQFLTTPIQQLCSQLRILNTLKYSSMKRFLTIEEFHFLKYQMKDKFIDIMLRYNMHYELDLMFGDSQAKARTFYHWAKCKIQKENPESSQKAESENNNERQQSLSNSPDDSSDNMVFQTIIQKYESMKDKFYPNNNLFSQLAKYCVDRNKLNLGLKLLQHQQDAQKKALVGLLILVAKKDRHLAQKVLQFTQLSKKSPIVYRIIKQLLHLTWIQKHLWTNLFHNRLIIQQHFIKYNQFIYMWDNVKDYFLQNKMLVDLGYMGIRQTIWEEAKEIVGREGIDVGEVGTRCLFNSQENEEIRQKIVGQFESLVPNTCLALKKHIPKPKSGLMILKKFKKQSTPIIQDDIDCIHSSLTDKQLQYLGQIIVQKDQNKQLATYVFMKIKSEKSYRILLKQGKYKEAIDLAFERRNLVMLKEVIETIKMVTQQEEEEFLCQYGEAKVRELEKKTSK